MNEHASLFAVFRNLSNHKVSRAELPTMNTERNVRSGREIRTRLRALARAVTLSSISPQEMGPAKFGSLLLSVLRDTRVRYDPRYNCVAAEPEPAHSEPAAFRIHAKCTADIPRRRASTILRYAAWPYRINKSMRVHRFARACPSV